MAKKEKLKLRKYLYSVVLLQKWLKKCLNRCRLRRKLAEIKNSRMKQAEVARKKELSLHKNNIIDKMEINKDVLTLTKNIPKNTNNKVITSKNKGLNFHLNYLIKNLNRKKF